MELEMSARKKTPERFDIRGIVHDILFSAFAAKNMHLLSSRLYCRLWNRTISVALLLHDMQ